MAILFPSYHTFPIFCACARHTLLYYPFGCSYPNLPSLWLLLRLTVFFSFSSPSTAAADLYLPLPSPSHLAPLSFFNVLITHPYFSFSAFLTLTCSYPNTFLPLLTADHKHAARHRPTTNNGPCYRAGRGSTSSSTASSAVLHPTAKPA
jgi:hypothetical protein